MDSPLDAVGRPIGDRPPANRDCVTSRVAVTPRRSGRPAGAGPAPDRSWSARRSGGRSRSVIR
ncbi:hypothetical protein AArcCO_0074 [Halalkaliarchaeum sp. AArc-CO]|nr:hypothetical protein AArcCO_0074 [Halalkaliarchaeum sp. AArc-CO]